MTRPPTTSPPYVGPRAAAGRVTLAVLLALTATTALAACDAGAQSGPISTSMGPRVRHDTPATVLSPGATSRQLVLWLAPSDSTENGCRPGQDVAVARQTADEVVLDVTVPIRVEGNVVCTVTDVPSTRRTVELASPLAGRRVVVAATGRAVPVLDTSTTPYADAVLTASFVPLGTLRAPYVLTSVAPGPVVTWAWLDDGTLTLQPQQPVPADETSLGTQRYGGRTVALSSRPGSLTARWQEDATHRWQLTVSRRSGGLVQNGQVVDYAGLPALVETFHPAS